MFTMVKFWGRRLAGPVFTISLLSLSLPFFIVTYVYSNHASALTYNNSIDLEYTFNPTLDVSFNTNTGFIIEDLAPGNASYSNTVVITASSNNSDGYNLLASVGDSNDANRNNNRLVNTNNVNYFESVAANADLELSALGENKWGYAIYNSDTSAWSNYNGLPAVSADSSNDLTLVSTDIAGDTEVMMRIGASATNTQVAGEFTNKINFFVTTNVVTYDYSITYNANDGSDGSSVSNMPTNVAGSLNTGDTLQTSSSIPTRSNYLFFGWCDGTVDNTTNGTITSPVCTNGNVYRANGYIKIANALKTDGTNDTLNSIALTAMWGKYAMQNVDLWSKDIKINEEVTAIDERDGTEYWVARLCMNASNPSACVNGALDENNINSKLWMTQNLDLVLGDTGVRTLTSNDSDINQDLGTTMGYTTSNGTITWTPAGGSMGTPSVLNSGTPADGDNASFVTGWTNSDTIPYQAEGGTRYVFTSGSSSNDTKFGTRWECIAAGHTDAECNHYHIGNYYNWTAAVASNDTSTWGNDYTGMPYYDAANSICPKGWRLPEGLSGSDSSVDSNLTEFNRLALAYGITTGRTTNMPDSPASSSEAMWQDAGWATNGFNNFRTSPLYFVRSGNVNGSALKYYATDGDLWSSTARSGSIAFSLYFTLGRLYPASQFSQYYGFPVRCIAR